MAIARASLLDPIGDIAVDVNKSALVIGGGVAGMTAALNLADQGFPASIVEKEAELGGAAKRCQPDLERARRSGFSDRPHRRVEKHPDIEVHDRMQKSRMHPDL